MAYAELTMLGEAGTTEIARRKDAQGFADNRTAAREGGAIAGKALEAKSGKPVVSKENYLAPPAKRRVASGPKKIGIGKE